MNTETDRLTESAVQPLAGGSTSDSAIARTRVIPLPLDRLTELAVLGSEFYGEGRLPGTFDPVVFTATWQQLLSTGAGGLFVLEEDGKMLGAIGAIAYPCPNNGETIAAEMFWYVRREHRGRGLRLFDAFEAWAKAKGARRLAMVHLLELTPAALERFYRSRGYRAVEVHYIKEV